MELERKKKYREASAKREEVTNRSRVSLKKFENKTFQLYKKDCIEAEQRQSRRNLSPDNSQRRASKSALNYDGKSKFCLSPIENQSI